MARRSRRNHSPAFEDKVAIAEIKGERTMIELAQDLDSHGAQFTCHRGFCAYPGFDFPAGPVDPRQGSMMARRGYPPKMAGKRFAALKALAAREHHLALLTVTVYTAFLISDKSTACVNGAGKREHG